MHDEETKLCIINSVGKICCLNFLEMAHEEGIATVCFEGGKINLSFESLTQHNTRQRLKPGKGCKM